MRHRAYIAASQLSDKSWEEHSKLEAELFNKYLGLLFGEQGEEKDRQAAVNQALQDAYVNMFGDPKDQDHQTKIETVATAMKQHRLSMESQDAPRSKPLQR